MKVMLVDGDNKAYSFLYVTNFNQPAIIGLLGTINKVAKKYSPDLIIVTWEGNTSFRYDLMDGYKANRGIMPDGAYESILESREILKSIGIAQASYNQFEADDVMASITKKLVGYDGLELLTIVSDDKDMYQCLISPSVMIYSPGTKVGRKFEGIINGDRFEEFFKFHVDYFTFYQFLVGDHVDTIAGIPGVGPTYAEKFINNQNPFIRMLCPPKTGIFNYDIIEKYEYLMSNDRIYKLIRDQGREYCETTWKMVRLVDDLPIKLDCNYNANMLSSVLESYGMSDDYKDNFCQYIERSQMSIKKLEGIL
jgi:5'-3' exonuclease